MNFDKNTLDVLKNFSHINPSIFVKKGNVIRTISPSKTVMAKATVDVAFESDFAIYDLSRFLSVLSLFETPDLTFHEQHVVIADKLNRKVHYRFASPDTIVTPPDRELKLPTPEVEFEFKNAAMNDVLKALSVLGLPELAVCGEDGAIVIKAIDVKGKVEDSFSVKLGETDKVFQANFKAENLKVLPVDYTVKICKGISQFVSPTAEYFIAVESTSKF